MSKKYYQIQSSSIQRSDFQYDNIRTFSQNKNLLTMTFNKYGIPEKYQKIYLYREMFSKLTDFFTGVSFDIQITPDKRINVFLRKKKDQSSLNFSLYTIYGYEMRCTTKEVTQFYRKLYDEKLLKNYLRALNEFFALGMDLDYLFEINESKKSAKSQQRLIRKRIK